MGEQEIEVRSFSRAQEAASGPDAVEDPQSRWFQLDPTPVLIVTDDATVLDSNSAARRLIQEQAPASISAGRLAFASAEARKSFSAALKRVAAGAAARAAVVLRCDDGRWRRLRLVRVGASADAGVFVSLGRETAPRHDISPLVEAFRLSAAEGKVLLHLAEGLAPKRIASKLDISPNTVRAHLRNLYLKMHVRGICDLVREYTRLTD